MSIFTISRSPGTTTDQGHLAMCFALSSEKGQEGPKRPPEYRNQISNHPRTLKTSSK